MSHPLRQVITFLHRPLLLLALSLGLLASAEPGHAAEAAMSVELPAKKWKAVRLRNLPKNAVMAVAVQSSGSIAVSLLNETDYRRFPRVQDPVFLGTVSRSLSFTIVVPNAGNYYLVLDNRSSGEVQKVKFVIRAQRGRAAPPQKQVPPGGGESRPDEM